jgi:hypothetical protein
MPLKGRVAQRRRERGARLGLEVTVGGQAPTDGCRHQQRDDEFPAGVGVEHRVVQSVDVRIEWRRDRRHTWQRISRQEAAGGGIIPPRPQVEQAGGVLHLPGKAPRAGRSPLLPQQAPKGRVAGGVGHLAANVGPLAQAAQAVGQRILPPFGSAQGRCAGLLLHQRRGRGLCRFDGH